MSDTGGYHAFTQRSSGRASEIQTEVKLRLGSSIAQQFGLSQETEVGGAAVWDTGAPFSVVSSRVIGGLALEPLGFVRLVGVGGSCWRNCHAQNKVVSLRRGCSVRFSPVE